MSAFARVLVLCCGLLTGIGVAACADPAEVCRFDPEGCPNGFAGAFCESDKDCQGFCCTDNNNCDGGMCTFECKSDDDCPVEMACEHDMCFYRCDSDNDCADGQKCEHGKTVCEWP